MTTPAHFGHVWALEVQRDGVGQVWDTLDFRATARWPRDGSPTVDVEVYHPPPSLIGMARDPATRWRVLAGYEDAGGATEIGGGVVIAESVRRRRADLDPTLVFQLSARRASSARILCAAWASTSALEVLRYVATEAGLAQDFRVDADADVLYARGYTLQGTPPAVVDEVCADLGCLYLFEGSTLRVWPASEPRLVTAQVWDVDSGLQDPPEPDAKGEQVTARALLHPGLRPGDVLRVSDVEWSGDLTLLEVVHTVDTRGDVWDTAVVGRPRR